MTKSIAKERFNSYVELSSFQTLTGNDDHGPEQKVLPSGGPPGPPGGWLFQHMSPARELAFNVVVCMVQLIPQACLTTCFPIIQTIASDFNIHNPSVMPWVVAAYSLSFGTTILLSGRLGDIFGHKKMVILGFCWLSVFSIIGGVSHYVSYELFFIARALQGIGSAMMNPNALALLGRSYPPGSKRKVIAFSAFALCAPLGAYMGMLFSAVVGQLAHWSWSFYTTAIVCVVLAVGCQFILPSPPKTPKQQLPFRRKLGQMDWLGGISGVTGLVAIQVSLICAPSQGWDRQYIFMLFILGVILIMFFILIELRLASAPLVPFTLLNADAAFVLAAVACGWATFGTWTYYLWRFFLNIQHLTPLQAALYALPIVPVALVAAALTACLMRTTKPAWILFGALFAFTLGPLFLSFNQPHSIYWGFTFVSLLVTPFGMDMSFPSATFVMSNMLPVDKQGVAGSLVVTVVNYSISLGLGLAATVEVHVNDQGRHVMKGIRGGWWFGVGVGALGMLVCAGFVVKSSTRSVPAASDTGPGRDIVSAPGKSVSAPVTGTITANATTEGLSSEHTITVEPKDEPKRHRSSLHEIHLEPSTESQTIIHGETEDVRDRGDVVINPSGQAHV